MHRHHALFRQEVVEQRKDRFLVLAGIGGVGDQDHPAVKVQRNHRFAAAAVDRRIGAEAGRLDNGVTRLEAGKLIPGRANEHVPGEEVMPRLLRHDTDGQAVLLVGACIEILHVDTPVLKIGLDAAEQPVERSFIHRLVDGTPVHVAFAHAVADDELVLRRAARVLAGLAE